MTPQQKHIELEAKYKNSILKKLLKIAEIALKCSLIKQEQYLIEVSYSTICLTFRIKDNDMSIINEQIYCIDMTFNCFFSEYQEKELISLLELVTTIENEVINYYKIIKKIKPNFF